MFTKKISHLIVLLFYFVALASPKNSFGSDFHQKSISSKLDNEIEFHHIQSDISKARVSIYVDAGHLYNGNSHGISHLTEHLFNLGGDVNNISKIDKFLASVNGERRATTNTTGVRYWYQFPKKELGAFFKIIENSFAGLAASQNSIAAQTAAINNEWKQGQRYQELIDWEQTFRVFAHPSEGYEPFFMGNLAEFDKQSDTLKAELNRLFRRYTSTNIIILSESAQSPEDVFNLINKTVGKVNLKTVKKTDEASQEISLRITPVTEVRRNINNDNREVQFTLAFTLDAKFSPVYIEFLIHLLNNSSIHSLNSKGISFPFSPTSIEYAPNELHSYDSLHLEFSRRENEETTIFDDAKLILTSLNSVLKSLVGKDKEADLIAAYNEFYSLYSLTCSKKSLSFQMAKKLDNQIHFGKLSNWLEACEIPREFDKASFENHVAVVSSAKIYTKLFASLKEWEALSDKRTMNHYEQSYVLHEPTEFEEFISLSIELPRKNALLPIAKQSVSANKNVRLERLGDKRFASYRVLKSGIMNIEDYAEAIIIEEYLKIQYGQLLSDASALGVSTEFIIDENLKLVASGDKSIVTFLANSISFPLSFSSDKLNIAKLNALRILKDKMEGNQVFRMNEFLRRLQFSHIWTDEQLLFAIENSSVNSSVKSDYSLSLPETKNLELKNNAPVNILASLRQIKGAGLEDKVYAVLLNSILRSKYKDRFRNELKIAYTAVTGHKLSDAGTGFVTLLQTSTHSIEEMKRMNRLFFLDILNEVKGFTKKKFIELYAENESELFRLRNSLEFVFSDSLVSQLSKSSINSTKPSLSDFQKFSEQLLSNDATERYVAIKGI